MRAIDIGYAMNVGRGDGFWRSWFARVLFVALCLLSAFAHALTELRHAHGIGYSADGNRILIPNGNFFADG